MSDIEKCSHTDWIHAVSKRGSYDFCWDCHEEVVCTNIVCRYSVDLPDRDPMYFRSMEETKKEEGPICPTCRGRAIYVGDGGVTCIEEPHTHNNAFNELHGYTSTSDLSVIADSLKRIADLLELEYRDKTGIRSSIAYRLFLSRAAKNR